MRLHILLAGFILFFVTNVQATTVVSTFTGGDAGDGLDFQGKFDYAVNFGGPGGAVIGDAVFTDDAAAGVSWFAPNPVPLWHFADYGATANDNALESVMQSIRYSPYPNALSVDLDNLVVGYEYKLQLLFAESCCDRGFDIYLENQMEVDNFNVGVIQGGINNTTTGVAVTYDFIASDSQLNIFMQGDLSFSDNNPILNAFTLENLTAVPETGTIFLLITGVAGLLASRRKRC